MKYLGYKTYIQKRLVNSRYLPYSLRHQTPYIQLKSPVGPSSVASCPLTHRIASLIFMWAFQQTCLLNGSALTQCGGDEGKAVLRNCMPIHIRQPWRILANSERWIWALGLNSPGHCNEWCRFDTFTFTFAAERLSSVHGFGCKGGNTGRHWGRAWEILPLISASLCVSAWSFPLCMQIFSKTRVFIGLSDLAKSYRFTYAYFTYYVICYI